MIYVFLAIRGSWKKTEETREAARKIREYATGASINGESNYLLPS